MWQHDCRSKIKDDLHFFPQIRGLKGVMLLSKRWTQPMYNYFILWSNMAPECQLSSRLYWTISLPLLRVQHQHRCWLGAQNSYLSIRTEPLGYPPLGPLYTVTKTYFSFCLICAEMTPFGLASFLQDTKKHFNFLSRKIFYCYGYLTHYTRCLSKNISKHIIKQINHNSRKEILTKFEKSLRQKLANLTN